MLSEAEKRKARYVLSTDGFATDKHRGVIVMHVADFLLREGGDILG